MPRRELVDDQLFNPDFNRLSDHAQILWYRMLLVSDDFGFVPAQKDQLLGLTNLVKHLRISSDFDETLREIALNHGNLYEINGKIYFRFNPVSFEAIQARHIRNRTQSSWLRVKSSNLDEMLRNSTKIPLARAGAFSNSINKSSLNSSKKRRVRKEFSNPAGVADPPNLNGNGTHPPAVIPDLIRDPDPNRSSSIESNETVAFVRSGSNIPEEVIRILHRIGRENNLREYTEISVTKWISRLRAAGNQYGYRCLLSQAEKFEVWMNEHIATESKKKNHKPMSRFLGWLERTHTQYHTTGDSEKDFPELTETKTSAYADDDGN